MTDVTKEEIEIVLELLKGVLVKNGVSIYLDGRHASIGFFDTKEYLETKNISGMKVNINDLVR